MFIYSHTVLGLLVMVGWSFGYASHLAYVYSHNYGTNEERVIATFGEMGGPVVHGECV